MEQPPCPGSASLPWLPPARQVSSTSTAQTAFFPKKDWSPTPGFLGWGWPKAWARSLCLGPGYPSVFLPVSLLLAQIRDGLDQAVFYTQCSLHWSPFLVPNSPFCVLISLFLAQISHFWEYSWPKSWFERQSHGKTSSSQALLLYSISHTAFPTAQGSFQTEMRTEKISPIWCKKSLVVSPSNSFWRLFKRKETL